MLMNNALKHSARLGQYRLQSTTAIYAKRMTKKKDIAGNWLKDPATYPLIVCMGAAGALVVGVMGSCLLYSPDVQIHPQKRGAVMRHWGF